MIVAAWMDEATQTLVERVFAAEAEGMVEILAEGPALTPLAVEALAVYAYNQQAVPQEVFLPGGAVEKRGPLDSDFLQGDMSRLLYQAVAWYQQLETRLKRIEGDWESWTGGGFGNVLRGEGETVCWIVRDLGDEVFARWTLQVESGGELGQSLTFVTVRDSVDGDGDKPASRDERLLVDAYRVYGRRINRVQHLLQHIVALGMHSTQEYRGWCRSRGLGEEELKSPQQRRRELALRAEAGRGGALFRETVARLCAGEHAAIEAEYLAHIAREFSKGLLGGARTAYRDLLLLAEDRANLFGLQPAIPRLGAMGGNSFVAALAQLARHYRWWIRPADTWAPETHDPRQQLGSLARHLLAEYPVPIFMDAAWCRGRRAVAQRQQAWFIGLGRGRNIRTAEGLPLVLSKRMAHEFAQAPDHYTIEEALRWGQVVGQGGDGELVEALLGTQLGTGFENEDFWSTVVHFFATNPMLDPSYVGPIIDYLHYRKYAPQELVQPGGVIETAPPPEPNLSMKSRSVPKLLDQVEAWHRHLNHEEKSTASQWQKSGVADFAFREKDTEHGGYMHWTITELLNKEELKTEGRALRHCVSSYADKCKEGKTSIWSLQVKNGRDETIRLVTIALQPRSRVITQVRSRHNLRPVFTVAGDTFSTRVEERFAWYLRRGKDMLRSWVQQESLGQKGSDLQAWVGR